MPMPSEPGRELREGTANLMRGRDMKKQIVALAIVALLVGVVVVPAQGQSRVKVQVPFEFAVADRSLPQGDYLITSVREKVLLQNSEGKTVAMALSNAVSGRSVGATGLAVFQCYEQRCFLSEIWNPTKVAGRQLMRSRWEKEVAKRKVATYFALLAEHEK